MVNILNIMVNKKVLIKTLRQAVIKTSTFNSVSTFFQLHSSLLGGFENRQN
jgi:hypothetical protein